MNRITRLANQEPYVLIALTLVLMLATVGLVACREGEAEVVCANVCTDATLHEFYIAQGGTALFGLPYTPLFTDPLSGRQVQYFDKARLEYDPNDPTTITIYPLGQWALAGLDEPTKAAVPSATRIRTFETGFTVQDQFLTFYEENNGQILFGQPISPQLEEADRRVQYFENARLEWHPEAPPNRQVQVGQLGRAHYMYEVYDPIASVFMPDDRVRVSSAEVTAAVSSPVLYGGDTQILYVIAQTSDRQPIAGLQVEVQISQSGRTITQQLEGETDALGTLQALLDLPDLSAGAEVFLTVSVRYPGQTAPIGQDSISFKVWW